MLQRWLRSGAAPARLRRRAAIVLACADGATHVQVARRLGVCPHTVGRWRARFAAERLAGLALPASAGAPARLAATHRADGTDTLGAPPGAGARLSTRQLARRLGVSQSSASRLRRELRLAPAASLLGGVDPALDLQRAVRWVGLLVHRSLRAFALLVRPPNAPIAALPGSAAAAVAPAGLSSRLDALEGRARRAGALSRHRPGSVRLRSFLKALARQAPSGHEVHVVVAGARRPRPAVRRWLAEHAEMRLHRVTTHAAWRGLLARWAAALAARTTAADDAGALAGAIDAHLVRSVTDPQPLCWPGPG